MRIIKRKILKQSLGKQAVKTFRAIGSEVIGKTLELSDNSWAAEATELRVILEVDTSDSKNNVLTFIDNGKGMNVDIIENRLLVFGQNEKGLGKNNVFGQGVNAASALGKLTIFTHMKGHGYYLIKDLFSQTENLDVDFIEVYEDFVTDRGFDLFSETGTIVSIDRNTDDGQTGDEIFKVYKGAGIKGLKKEMIKVFAHNYEMQLKKGNKISISIIVDGKEEKLIKLTKKDIFEIELSESLSFEKTGTAKDSFKYDKNGLKFKTEMFFTPSSAELNKRFANKTKEERETLFDGKYNPYKKNKVNFVLRMNDKVIISEDISYILQSKVHSDKQSDFIFKTKHNSLNDLFIVIDLESGLETVTTKNGFNKSKKDFQDFLTIINKKLNKLGVLSEIKRKQKEMLLKEKEDEKEMFTKEHDKGRDKYVARNYKNCDFSENEFIIRGSSFDNYSEKDGISTILEYKSKDFKHTEQMITYAVTYLNALQNKNVRDRIKRSSSKYSNLNFHEKVIYKIVASEGTELTGPDNERIEIIESIFNDAGFDLKVELEYN